MDDELMFCPVCGTRRVSRYAAYCHKCGSPLPELPPDPADPPVAAQGWEDPAAAASAVFANDPNAVGYPDPVSTYPSADDSSTANQPGVSGVGGYPPGTYQAGQPDQHLPPGGQPVVGGGVRVYDRPDTPPSVVRRRRLTWIIAGVGVLVGLLLLVFGPLRNVLGARSQPDWMPPSAETPIAVGNPTLPPGVSAAQATARARHTPTPTVIVTVPVSATAAGGGAVATVTLPTLAPAPTVTLAPTITALPTATQVPPTATARPPTATVAPPTATPPTPAPNGAALPGAISGGRALAFVSDRSGSPQIWVISAAGGQALQVTNQGQNTSPAWSLDNRYLYYISARGAQAGVYRLDITTGTEQAVLQDSSVVSARPLPDGRLATLRTENGRYALYVDDRRLFQLDRSFQFQFSPGGNWVVIDPNVDPRAISVVDVATTKAQEVAPAKSWNAGWGQGDRLTYVSDRSGIAAVYVAGRTGEAARAVSPGNKWSQAPAFSSDGSLIAFIAGDGPAWNVYMVGANGRDAHRVGSAANPGKSPVWQPGGQLLAYESNRAGNWDIYLTDTAGNERALTTNPSNDVDPAWTW